MVEGGYTPCYFVVKRGYTRRQTRSREAPPRAPNCHKFSSVALARFAQPLSSMHTFLLFFEHVGANGTAAHEGSYRDPPFWPHVGGVCPRKSTTYMYYPRLTIISLHLTELISLHDHLLWQPEEQVQYTSTRHGTTARTAQGPNNRQLRVVAIDFSGKSYTNNQVMFKTKYFIIPKHTHLCKLENQIRRNTTAVGGGWYNAWYRYQGNYWFSTKGAFYFLISSFIFNRS